MAYATYTTEAIVCGSHERGGADRSYLLFTRDAGMLWASARSVREERSKQRFALQEFSLVRVSLVRGKAGWRVGSVEALDNPFSKTRSREIRGSIVKIVRLLRRYIHGEEPQEAVYLLANGALELAGSATLVDRTGFELLFELNLLALLGYVSTDEAISAHLHREAAGLDRSLSEGERRLIEGRIEAASSASQL